MKATIFFVNDKISMKIFFINMMLSCAVNTVGIEFTLFLITEVSLNGKC